MVQFTPVYGEDAIPLIEVQKNLASREGCTGRYWRVGNDPLIHTDWHKVLIGYELHDAIFWGHQGETGWPQRPDLPDMKHNIDPLLWCLRDLGRTELVLACHPEVDPTVVNDDKTAYFIRCSTDIASVHAACEFYGKQEKTSAYGILAFDPYGDWVIVDGDEDWMMLAGTPEFIKQYNDSAGGEEYVRAWFYQHDILHDTDWDEDTGLPNKYTAMLYDYVGWPYPVYPKDRYLDEDIDWSPMFGDRIKSSGWAE